MTSHSRIYRQPRRWWQLKPLLRSERWENRPDLREGNKRRGACNTGARADGVCELGGIGCNVDHAAISFRNNVGLGRLWTMV